MSDNNVTIIQDIKKVVVSPLQNNASSEGTDNNVTVSPEVSNFTITCQGSPGLKGEDGVNNSFKALAGANLSGHRAVVIFNGQAYLADPTDASHGYTTLAIIRDSALLGEEVECFLSGEINGGSFTANTDYFVGLAGALSTTPRAPGAVWVRRIGTSKNTSVLIVDMDPLVLV